MLLIDLGFRKLGRKNLHDITMLDPRHMGVTTPQNRGPGVAGLRLGNIAATWPHGYPEARPPITRPP